MYISSYGFQVSLNSLKTACSSVINYHAYLPDPALVQPRLIRGGGTLCGPLHLCRSTEPLLCQLSPHSQPVPLEKNCAVCACAQRVIRTVCPYSASPIAEHSTLSSFAYL